MLLLMILVVSPHATAATECAYEVRDQRLFTIAEGTPVLASLRFTENTVWACNGEHVAIWRPATILPLPGTGEILFARGDERLKTLTTDALAPNPVGDRVAIEVRESGFQVRYYFDFSTVQREIAEEDRALDGTLLSATIHLRRPAGCEGAYYTGTLRPAYYAARTGLTHSYLSEARLQELRATLGNDLLNISYAARKNLCTAGNLVSLGTTTVSNGSVEVEMPMLTFANADGVIAQHELEGLHNIYAAADGRVFAYYDARSAIAIYDDAGRYLETIDPVTMGR